MQVLFEKTLFKGNGHWRIEAVSGFTGPTTEPQDGMLIAYATTEGGSEVIKFTPTKGKNIGKSNETTPAQQAVSEAESRVSKQRDRGYVDTREEAQAGPATNTLGKLKPMLATDLDKVKPEAIDWDNAFLQPKLDGHRCLFDEIIYSRGGKEHNVQHILDEVKSFIGEGIHLDGELYIHGVSLQKLGSLIKKPQEASLDLEYHVYDQVSDDPFEQRIGELQKLFDSSEGERDARICLVPTVRVRSMAEALEQHAKWVKLGYEGSILRHGELGYEDDKRSKSLLKIKDFSDLEVEVVDFVWGTPNRCEGGGEYLNPVLVYRVPGTELLAKVTAPGSHLEKHEQGLRIEEKMGKKLTIEHMGFTKDGVPNIATAKCWYEPL